MQSVRVCKMLLRIKSDFDPFDRSIGDWIDEALQSREENESEAEEEPDQNQIWLRASYKVTSSMLADMYKNKTLNDVILVVHGEEFYAHKAVLATVSPVFKAMLTGGLKEGVSKDYPLRIDISEAGFEKDVVELFLGFVYKGKALISKDVEEEGVAWLFRLADMYQVDMLLQPLYQLSQKMNNMSNNDESSSENDEESDDYDESYDDEKSDDDEESNDDKESDDDDGVEPIDILLRAPDEFQSSILMEMHEKNTLCDVILIVQEEEYLAHLPVLASVSPVFQSMFTNRLKDITSTENMLKAQVIDTTSEMVQKLLCFIYKGQVTVQNDYDDEMILKLLRLAHAYQIKVLIKAVDKYFADKKVTEDTYAKLWSYGVSFDLIRVKRSVLKVFKKSIHKLIGMRDFKDIPIDLMIKLAEIIDADDDSHMFSAAISWIQADNDGQRSHHVDSVFDSLKLRKMNTFELSRACETVAPYSAHSAGAKRLQERSQVRRAEIPVTPSEIPECHMSLVSELLEQPGNTRAAIFSEKVPCGHPIIGGYPPLRTGWTRLLDSPYEVSLFLDYEVSRSRPHIWINYTLSIALISGPTCEDEVIITMIPFLKDPEYCKGFYPAQFTWSKVKVSKEECLVKRWFNAGFICSLYDRGAMVLGATLVGDF